MARAAESRSARPMLITVAIAAVLASWAACAFSAAGAIARLPLLRPALFAISAVLILRGIGLPVMRAWRPDLSAVFLYWSSALALIYGLTFAVGTWKAWPSLASTEAFR